MYEQHLLQPRFDLRFFIASYEGRKIDTEREGYDIIPEALDYFRELVIPQHLLEGITTIYQDGGNDIYLQISPLWDGEDDRFNITSADDAALFPSLREMTIFYGTGSDEVLNALKVRGINARYL